MKSKEGVCDNCILKESCGKYKAVQPIKIKACNVKRPEARND